MRECKYCEGTLRLCECRLLQGGDLHAPHGSTWWEMKGRCYKCCDHEWGEARGSMAIRWCSVCGVGREAKNFAGVPDVCE